MITLFILTPIILLIVLLSVVVRVITLPFRLARPRRWNGGYGLGTPYRYGYRRRHRFGGVGTVLALFALDRLFSNRRF